MNAYLVTGAAGMIGAKVAEMLLRRGDHVVGVDNLCDSYDTRLKRWRLDQLTGRAGFTFAQVDIAEYAPLESLFANQATLGNGPFVAVINLAARAGVRDSVIDPWAFFRSNVDGTLNLLELCRRHNVGKFVLASTASLYGPHNPQPFREDAVTEVLLSPYAASKKAAEALCSTYHYLHGIDITVPRYFTVYGPAGRPDMAPFRFVKWITDGQPVTLYGDGTQERDFTFVDDIARGTLAALKPVGFEVVNLGTERTTKLNDLIGLIENLAEHKAIIHPEPRNSADMMSTWADTSKAKALLDWEATTPIEEGMRHTVDWYRENHDWAKTVELGI